MMRILLTLLLAAASTVGVAAGAGGQAIAPDPKTERELRALRGELLDALKRGDKVVLERLLADGFVFIHSTGVMERRSEFIGRAVAAAGGGGQGDVEFLDDDLRIYGGHTAVWVTRSRRRASGTSVELNFRGTDVLVKAGRRWQWASVQSTRLPTRPQAVAVDAGVYTAVVGRYETGMGRTVTITGDVTRLRVEATGGRPAELIAASPAEFVWFDADSNVDARLEVIRDVSGAAREVVLRREGVEVWRAQRVD